MAIPTDHHIDDDSHLEPAVAWYAANRDTCPRPIVPHIRRMFGHSARDAVQVLRLGNLRADWPEKGGADADAS